MAASTTTQLGAVLREALRQHRAGAFDRAQTLYAEALALDPAHPDALHLAGVLAYQQRRLRDATGLLDRAIASAGSIADFWNSRAAVHRAAGDLAAASYDLQRALALNPAYVEAQVNLGEVLTRQGQHEAAAVQLQAAIAQAPRHARAHDALGVVLIETGARARAIASFRQALALAPDMEAARCHLGVALAAQGETAAALKELRHAIRVAPGFVEAHFNLANVLQSTGDLPGAIAAYRRVVELDRAYLNGWNNLGLALRAANDDAAARQCFERALTIGGDSEGLASIANNLGNLLASDGDLIGAIKIFERALALQPKDAKIHLNFGKTLQQANSGALADIHIARALELDPQQKLPIELSPFTTLYGPMKPAELIARAQKSVETLAGQRPMRRRDYPNRNDPLKRLRVGYISPDFRTHSVANFIEPVLRAHDRSAVEVYCYASVEKPDRLTTHLQGLADHWRNIFGRSDQEAADMIGEDAIDILIDLAGHTRGGRLGVLALQPAPVQATWIGYAGTTGLDAIDWRMTDSLADPLPRTDAHFTEQLLRLPGGFLCYAPIDDLPPVAQRSTRLADAITFGSFNHIAKVRDGVIEAWSEILHRQPRARLVLKSQGLDCPTVADIVRLQFRERGIELERVELLSFAGDRARHLETYGQIDIALDPFPYNGTTTTCEALWMGVPVISLVGDQHRSRVGVSLLTRAGLAELLADDRAGYIDLAVSLATDRARLDTLRANLRARAMASALADAKAITIGLESGLRQIWQAWCAPPAT
jgi:predicted O-linked N-acetylglucosamine transferase (SPINDLY family)